MSGQLCWFDFGDHTCMLPDGHDGSHKPTSNDDILVGLAPEDADWLINITVYER